MFKPKYLKIFIITIKMGFKNGGVSSKPMISQLLRIIDYKCTKIGTKVRNKSLVTCFLFHGQIYKLYYLQNLLFHKY